MVEREKRFRLPRTIGGAWKRRESLGNRPTTMAASADPEALDFEPEEDDLMDEDGEASPRGPPPKLRSAITGVTSQSAPRKTKGRGFREEADINIEILWGYALIEYENFEEAQAAIAQMNGTELLTQAINVEWAFSSGPINKRRNMNTGHAVYPPTCEDLKEYFNGFPLQTKWEITGGIYIDHVVQAGDTDAARFVGLLVL
ncbi:hypothetical protein SAY86_014520 [Trapa natans]|uniref:RRM domain-containing protein n=1 Tax=Trapa natans TaxID=22666 RepID=A0AAN7QRF6_TRANT|nr:hypothetical protein SAY86_014520 [Trapa natans]